jgi:tetratricopeptide (TPR) repeat protein
MVRPLALVAVLLLTSSAAADDANWTGKSIRLTSDGVKTGSKFRGGLVRDGAALDRSKTYIVKSDDGSYLELVGRAGFIFKIDAELVAGVPAPPARPDTPAAPPPPPEKKNLWPPGTSVLPKRRPNEIPFEYRDAAGKSIPFELSGIMPMSVRSDPGDGRVRVHDGHREGWVGKDDLVTSAAAPDYWDRAVRADPRDTWALYMRGNGWWQKGDPDAAVRDFDACIRLNPADAAAYNSRGNARRDKRELDKAIDDFTRAIRLDPRFTLAYHNRGSAWRDKGDLDRAIDDFSRAIRLDPKYAPPFINRGFCRTDRREYDRAIADFSEALGLDPAAVPAYYGRGVARLANNEYVRAVADLTEAVRLAPDAAAARVARGAAHHRLRQYDDALADFAAALRLDPRCADALGRRAVTLAKLKKYAEAARGFEAAVGLDPTDRLLRDYAFFLATCPDEKYRDARRAVELAKKAVEKAGRADGEYAAARAAAFAAAGEFGSAIADQQKALNDETLDRDARTTLEARLKLYRAKKPYRDE